MTPRLQKLVLGENQGDKQYMSLLLQLYKSIVEVLIQSVESTTRDLREMLRLLRIIWPFYLKPLLNADDSDNGNNLLENFCSSSSVGNDELALSGRVSEKLGQKVRPYIRRILNECLLQPGQTLQEVQVPPQYQKENDRIASFSESLPYYTKFFLLAAYLCQANKADHDQKLYTNKASGRRRKKKNPNDSFAENMTHASSIKAQQMLRSEKVPSFPLERLLSIFSSIFGKYATVSTKTKISSKDLGSISLFASLAELRQLGFLSYMEARHHTNKSHTLTTSMTKYVCNLSRDEAALLSSQVQFPLVDYLAENL
jgi:hypothetical protein